MKAESFRRLSQLFEEARELAGQAREELIARACGADGELRQRLEELLREHEAAGDGAGISSPELSELAAQVNPRSRAGAASAPASSAASSGLELLELRPGAVVDGKYKLLETIGEGGLGAVYLAEQLQPVKRRVALKVVKLGMDTKQVLGRFEVERNTLTLLDHPGIARLYDAGVTERGRPYFVMEHIQGLPITELANREQMGTQQRLELFLRVCAAVQHAHQKGIIHRDLKPSNILVALKDGKPEPKIIDFGIAKATAQQLTERTVYTEQGQLIGTPEYMSPEQAEMTGLGIDSTTDIYSLGVILYELLTGVLPFDSRTLRGKGIHEIQRLIREEDPVKPSTRVSTLGTTTEIVVKQRRTEPRALWRELKGDLDWITMKAMEKLRTRRYASASELAADVQRHLDHQPVAAGPPGSMYKLRKFVRRNRALVVSTVLVAAALLAGVIGTTWGMLESQAERDKAMLALGETEKARDAAREAQADAVRERQKTEAALEQAEVNVYYSRIAQAELSYRLHDLTRSELSLAECLPAPARADRRGWEWHYLRGLTRAAVRTLEPHNDVVYALAFSADGNWIAAGGGVPGFYQFSGEEPGELKLWDAAAGRLLHDLSGAQAPVTGLSFDPGTGTLLAGAANIKTGARTTLHSWDPRSAARIVEWPITEEARGIGFLDFDSSGRWLTTTTRGAVTLWDAVERRPLRTLSGQVAANMSADGQTFTTYGGDGTVTRWRVESGEQLHQASGFPVRPEVVVFGPDERLVAAVGARRDTVLVQETATGRLLCTLRSHPEETHAAAFSPDGRLLATCGSGGTVRLWSLRDGEERYRFLGHSNRLVSLAFSPGGERLASGGWDRRVRVWDLTRHPERVQLASPSGRELDRAEAIAFRDDGSVVTTHPDGAVRIWDGRTGIPLDERRVLNRCDFFVPSRKKVFAADGRRLFQVTRDERIMLSWDVDAGREERAFQGHALPIQSISVASRSHRVATAGGVRGGPKDALRGEIKIWSWDDGSEVFAHEVVDSEVFSLGLGPDGDWLAVAHGERDPGSGEGRVSIRLWDVAARNELPCPASGLTWTEAFAFDPGGRRWAVGDASGRVLLFDLERLRRREVDAVAEPSSLRAPVGLADLAFSPDGRRLAGTNRELVTIWDTTTGHEILRLRGRSRTGSDPMFNPRLVFSRDEARLAATQWDNLVNIWSAEDRGDASFDPSPSAGAVFAWHLREAADSLAEGDLAAASLHLRDVAGAEAPSRSLLIDRARVLARAGRLQEAIDGFSAALAAVPDDAFLLESRGWAHARAGELSAAAADFARAATLVPGEDLEAREGQAFLCLETGDAAGLRQALAALPELLARSAMAPRALAHLLLALESTAPSGAEEHLKALQDAARAVPQVMGIRLALAAAHLRLGQAEEATARLAEDLRSTPPESVSAALARLLAAAAERRQGRAEAAGRHLAQARTWQDAVLGPGREPSAAAPSGVDWREWVLFRALLRRADR